LEIIFREEAHSIQDSTNEQLQVNTTSNGTYLADNIVVATGFYDTPRKLNVPGENLPKVKHYYDDVHPYIKQKVLVVGAANSACDVALETWSKVARFGIEWDDTDLQIPLFNEDTLESTRKGVYLAGVVNGGLHTSRYFIENTSEDGEKIIRDILLKTSIT